MQFTPVTLRIATNINADGILHDCHRLQQEGTWRHLWRLAGLYANVSIFDVADNQSLHDTLVQLPLYTSTEIEVTPICRHPSSIHADDR